MITEPKLLYYASVIKSSIPEVLRRFGYSTTQQVVGGMTASAFLAYIVTSLAGHSESSPQLSNAQKEPHPLPRVP